jgi:hypothetical protein
MTKDRIVAVGLLTSRELAMLGEQFVRYFLSRPDPFTELLAPLDQFEARLQGDGVTIQRKPLQ